MKLITTLLCVIMGFSLLVWLAGPLLTLGISIGFAATALLIRLYMSEHGLSRGRTERRFALLPGVIRIKGDGFDGYVVDCSRSGLGVIVNEIPKTKELVRVWLDSNHHLGEKLAEIGMISLHGEIQWIMKLDSGKHRMGIRLKQLEFKDKRRLLVLLRGEYDDETRKAA